MNSARTKMAAACAFLAVIGTMTVGTPAPAQQVFYPTGDTYEALNDCVSNYGSSTSLLVRNRYGGGGLAVWETDAMIRFDLSSIPRGTAVTQGRLYLYYYGWWDNNPAGRRLDLHRLLGDWSEGTLNWCNLPPHASAVSAGSDVPSSYGWMTWDVTADVQAFVGGSAANYGWFLTDPVPWNDYNIPTTYFYSKENGSNRPHLEVVTGGAIANVRAAQRAGSLLCDVYYDSANPSGPLAVSASASTDAGATWSLALYHVSGDGIGPAVLPARNLHFVWDAGADLGPGYFPNVMVRVSGGGASATSGVFPVNLRGLGGGLTVGGQVLDGATGTGVGGAQVQLGPSITATDSRGWFNFSSVAVGDYTLSVSKAGYATAAVPLSVTPGSSPWRVVTLYALASPGSAPQVTGITSKFPGFRYFLDGVPLGVQFTATVDWAGHPPGTVGFVAPRNSYTVATSGSTASQTLAMGSDFGPNGRLRVVAVSSDGTISSARQADLVVVPNPFPGPMGLLWNVADQGNDLEYSFTTTSPQHLIDSIGVDPGVIPADIPLVGGEEMKLGFVPEVTYEASSSDGTMQISMAWSDAEAGKLLDKDWGTGQLAQLTDDLKKFIDAGRLTKLAVPEARFGDLSLSVYPILGGGWKYDSDAGQWKWWDAEVGLAGDFSAEQTWPFLVGPVPMYAKIKFDLLAQASEQLLNTAPVSLKGELDLKPSLRGSLGVGLDEVLAIEGWVEGGLGLELQYPTSPTIKDAFLYVKAGATIYVLVFSKEWTMGEVWWDLYGQCPNLVQPWSPQSSSGLRPLGRGYLDYPAAGVMGRTWPRPKLFGSSRDGANPEVLMSPAFPFSDPNCSSSGTNCYLVFLADNTSRTSLNRTMAMFSWYDGTMWALPVPLADDGTADFHPRILAFADGSAVAAWENEWTVQPDTAALSNMVSNLGVSVAWYDPAAGWFPAQSMPTERCLNRSPKVAGRSPDNVLLTWVSNPANDLSGSTTAPNQIWSARWDGAQWGSPQLVATVLNALVKYDLLYDGTTANLVLSVDTVDGSTNANGHELFWVAYQGETWGPLMRLTSDQVPDDKPQMAFDPQGNVVLVWLKGGALSTVVNFDMASPQVARTDEYSSNLADFKLASSADGKLAVLWSEPSENNSDLWAMVYDPVFGTWGTPKQLTHDPETERDVTAAFYGTNQLIAVYDRSMVSSTNSVGTTLSELAAYYFTLSEDLALNQNVFHCDPSNPSTGGLATFHVQALNLGDQVETNVVVAFYRDAVQPASEVGRVTLTNPLPPQGTNDLAFTWAVPVTNAPIAVFAVVDPDGAVTDANRSNNVVRLDIAKPDALIQSMSWSSVGSNQVAVTIRVANDGAVGTGALTLSLNRDSAAGTNLLTQAIAGLAPGESTDVVFVWNVWGLPDDLNVYAVLSGAGVANNFTTGGLTSTLAIHRVLPPAFGACQCLPDGTFQMQAYGEVGRSYALLVSTNLVNWTTSLNFTCTNLPTILTDTKRSAAQFYRIAQ
ncbi:MAG: DNRLRE domain-containing protein [Verrucomicrobiota bacterium]|jgi:hypothetical protein